MNKEFEKVCALLYQDALQRESQWARQIRMVEPTLQGDDQTLIHEFFRHMVSNIENGQINLDASGNEIIKANIESMFLKSIYYRVGNGTYLVSKERLGAIRALLQQKAKERHENISSKLLDDPDIFNLVSGWVWEDWAERFLAMGISTLTEYEYKTDENGNRILQVTSPQYSVGKMSNKQKDMVINFDINFDGGVLPLNLDIKRNLQRFHVGDLTYTPIQIDKKIDDAFNLVDFLKTEVIKHKMAKTFPVFLSLKGGIDTLLSSEILSQPDNFFLKSEQKMPSNDEIHEMAVKILEHTSDPQHPSAKEVKQIVNHMGLNMIKGNLWYAR